MGLQNLWIYSNWLLLGDRLRADLRRKEVPSTKMAILEQKFDEVKEEGLLLKSALNHNGHDEPDNVAPVRPTKLVKRTVSATAKKPTCLDVASSGIRNFLLVVDCWLLMQKCLFLGDAGAVTWDIFEASFELVPQLTIFHQRDMDDQFKTINAVIGDKNMDWEKRVDAVRLHIFFL